MWIESGAGLGSGFTDAQYKQAGAQIVSEAEVLWNTCELILKVKEPLPEEYPLMRAGQTRLERGGTTSPSTSQWP